MQDFKKGVILVSGGLDSTTLCYLFMKKCVEFVPLIINYGQHCFKTELDRLNKVLPEQYVSKIEILDISDIYKYSNSKFIKASNLWEESITADDLYIPYRNVLILTVAASFARTLGLNNVYSAFINSNHAKEIDCSNDFFNNLESLLKDYGSVKIEMPFRDYSKFEVAKLGIELGAPIGKTFSCQASPDVPCGACPNCVDRLEALKRLSE
ncbi:7-cyano-7-deazaguanine synthase [Leeuwenhoekiella aestuarii]|uniref:7-cyano-7-deazaguanine synthase n=1 Tax=Leeuwenhoekiella aestuarii TaxID=2249426 RepID=A0A4Q0NT77_9FLAO|nr:7-cyano-7-deazaguanine synthase [Leeuwenhoekiella aestuarii]RXG14202.1 7-cyano-7-deazaguanine synthase [Leeuwenhoekiella aestuarii]RXG18951.1 7-cyano-7-deazaguanine synthase [Leeuwenhoekiella aestuarii]